MSGRLIATWRAGPAIAIHLRVDPSLAELLTDLETDEPLRLQVSEAIRRVLPYTSPR